MMEWTTNYQVSRQTSDGRDSSSRAPSASDRTAAEKPGSFRGELSRWGVPFNDGYHRSVSRRRVLIARAVARSSTPTAYQRPELLD